MEDEGIEISSVLIVGRAQHTIHTSWTVMIHSKFTDLLSTKKAPDFTACSNATELLSLVPVRRLEMRSSA